MINGHAHSSPFLSQVRFPVVRPVGSRWSARSAARTNDLEAAGLTTHHRRAERDEVLTECGRGVVT
jgi:hypothetical protein